VTALVGHPAPWIDVEAYRRHAAGPLPLAADDLRGRWSVLVFYPRDFTSTCPTELRALGQLEDEFARSDAAIVAVSTDSYWSHKAWFETHPALAGASYPVVADTTRELTRAFGVLAQDGSALRATFVLDPDGIVRHATMSDPSVARNPEETLRVLRALRSRQLSPVAQQSERPALRIAA
jgi:peroxiredoxin (alkyl hydroperoxide reductase subunit C)